MTEPAATESTTDHLVDASKLGIVSAPLGRRSLAFIMDAAIVAVPAIPAIFVLLTLAGEVGAGGIPTPSGVELAVLIGSSLLVDILIVVQLILHGRRGWTFGALATGIRTVNVTTLARPGFWRMTLRALVLYLAGVVAPVIGAVIVLGSPIWNLRGRGWLDLIGRDWMVDVRRGLDPFDAPAVRAARRRIAAERVPTEPEFPSLATGSSASAVGLGGRSRSAVVGVLTGPVTGSLVPPPAPSVEQALVPPPPVELPFHDERIAASAPAVRPPALISEDRDRLDLSADRMLLGRNPTAPPGDRSVALLRIDDATFSISKTHAEVTVHEDGLRVTDRDSSNGTRIRRRDGDIRLTAGKPAHLRWGDTLVLGDREFTLTEGGSAG